MCKTSTWPHTPPSEFFAIHTYMQVRNELPAVSPNVLYSLTRVSSKQLLETLRSYPIVA